MTIGRMLWFWVLSCLLCPAGRSKGTCIPLILLLLFPIASTHRRYLPGFSGLGVSTAQKTPFILVYPRLYGVHPPDEVQREYSKEFTSGESALARA